MAKTIIGDTMQQSPNCHLQQEAKKQWVYQIDAKTKLYVEKPKKLNLYGIFFGSASLFVILLKVFLLADSQAHNGDLPTNPKLGFVMIFGALIIAIVFCIGILIYRRYSYPRKMKEYEDLKKKSDKKYCCYRCGFSWGI